MNSASSSTGPSGAAAGDAPPPPAVPPPPPRPGPGAPRPGLGTALGAGSLGLALLITALVVAGWGPLLSLDGEVARWLHGHAVTEPGLTHAAFPSGHALTATVTCGLLLWLVHSRRARPWLRRTAVAVAAVSVAGVGFTRLWLGVHWGSDVMGGWLLGGALVWLSTALFRRLALSRGW